MSRLLPWPLRVAAIRARDTADDVRRRIAAREVVASFSGQCLAYTVANDIVEIELRREPCNEIGTTMLAELEQVATLIRGGAHGARAMIWHSTVKRGFSAGADLRELHAGIVDRSGKGASKLAMALEIREFIERIHAVFDTFDTAPLVTVGAIHGFCFGGGFELALTCDVLVADKSARFAFPELRLGIVPGFGGIPRLRRDLGNAVVRDLLLTGRSMGAARAHEIGLVSQVVARGEALGVARLVAEQATNFDAATIRRAKAFTKPLPREELEREKDLFVEMVGSPTVERALARFVTSDDVRPYLA